MVAYILKFIKDIVEVIIKWLLFFIVRIHKWMKQKPSSDRMIDIFSNMFISMSSTFFTVLIMPGAYSHIGAVFKVSELYAVGILFFLSTIIFALLYCIFGFVCFCRGDKINMPKRYKFLFSVLSFPATMIFHYYLIPLAKPLIKIYEQKLVQRIR